MPPSNPILQIFGRSPLRPLQEHIDKVLACTKTLQPFFDAVMADDWQRATELQHTIVDLEHQADALKKQLRINLPSGLFLPVDRGDILDVLRSQDRVANRAKDIAGLMLGRHMQIPSTLIEPLKKFVNRSIDAAAQAHRAIHELDDLLESGFSGHEAELVEEMIHELDLIEHDTDEMQIAIRRILYGMEKNLPPIDVMFLYNIIEWIGDLADRAQQVGAQLQLLLIK